jgi:hypothetical protein
MLRANSGGASAMASAGKKQTSRTNRQPITGSSPDLIGARRYPPIRARISSTLTTPFASPNNSQASETRSRAESLKKPPPTSLLCG